MIVDVLITALVILGATLWLSYIVSFSINAYFNRKEHFVKNLVKLFGEAAEKMLGNKKEK